MDGHFVPNLTLGPAIVQALRPLTRLPFDAHLMLARPAPFFEPFARAGADAITFHIEACPDPGPLFDQLFRIGVRRGLSLNPDTPVERLAGHLGAVDQLLVMTVFPGFGGQSLLAGSAARVKRARALLSEEGPPNALVEVDGGITPENAASFREAGASILVAGTAVFGAADMALAIRALKGG